MMGIEQEILEWRHRRHPNEPAGWEPVLLAAKLAEEAGELARTQTRFHEGRKGGDVYSQRDELGDVLIVCAAIAARLGLTLDDVLRRRFAEVSQR